MAKDKPVPVVTESNRKRNPGVVNVNRGIEVAPGLTLQDVPRAIIQQHLRQNENFWKSRFNQKYSGLGGQQTF